MPATAARRNRRGRSAVTRQRNRRRLRGVNIPPGMQVVLQGKSDFLQEVSARMAQADINVATGPLPGTS